jgi:hypothetical protein
MGIKFGACAVGMQLEIAQNLFLEGICKDFWVFADSVTFVIKTMTFLKVAG